MSLRFNPLRDGSQVSSYKPPPNYASRRVQLRLLMLVSALMLVIVVMFEARDPNNYRWMGFDHSEGGPLEPNEWMVGDVDTRLNVLPHSPGEPLAIDDQNSSPEFDIVRRESVQVWSKLLDGLARSDRQGIYKVLSSSRASERMADDQLEQWRQVLRRLDSDWQEYHNKALAAVLALDDEDEEKKTWMLVLHKLQTNWHELSNALQSVAEGKKLSALDKRLFEEQLEIMDEIALRKVEDNTVVSRGAEYDAWFRLFDELQASTARAIEQRSQGRVGFLQLFKQPTTYRGQLVTVRGTIRMGYHIRESRNLSGIEGYYVFVLKPAGGPNSPILVYALQTPQGFPTIKDRDLDKGATSLEEEAEFTGFFFKNCAYEAIDGVRIAPLLLAKVATWRPPEGGAKASSRDDIVTLIGCLFATAALGAMITLFIHRLHRGASPSPAPLDLTMLEQLRELAAEDATPYVVDDQGAQSTHDLGSDQGINRGKNRSG